MDIVGYLVTSLVLNLPFGIYRARTAKFSVAWFLAIHLPIPVIIASRLLLDVSPWLIPAGIAVAIVGQVIGARVLAPDSWTAIGVAKKSRRDARKNGVDDPKVLDSEVAGA